MNIYVYMYICIHVYVSYLDVSYRFRDDDLMQYRILNLTFLLELSSIRALYIYIYIYIYIYLYTIGYFDVSYRFRDDDLCSIGPLFPIRTDGDGNCLLHAISIGMITMIYICIYIYIFIYIYTYIHYMYTYMQLIHSIHLDIYTYTYMEVANVCFML
jgi:hypothetical protein